MHEQDKEDNKYETEFASIMGTQRLMVGIDKVNKGIYLNIPWQKAGGLTLSPEVAEKLVLELAYLINILKKKMKSMDKKEEDLYKNSVLSSHGIEFKEGWYYCNDGDGFDNIWAALDHIIFLDLISVSSGAKNYQEIIDRLNSQCKQASKEGKEGHDTEVVNTNSQGFKLGKQDGYLAAKKEDLAIIKEVKPELVKEILGVVEGETASIKSKAFSAGYKLGQKQHIREQADEWIKDQTEGMAWLTDATSENYVKFRAYHGRRLAKDAEKWNKANLPQKFDIWFHEVNRIDGTPTTYEEIEKWIDGTPTTYEEIEKCMRDSFALGVELTKSLIESKSFFEVLASLEHDQWSHWEAYRELATGKLNKKGINNDENWKRQRETPYEKLTEKEKDSDRHWANKVVKAMLERIEKEKKG